MRSLALKLAHWTEALDDFLEGFYQALTHDHRDYIITGQDSYTSAALTLMTLTPALFSL